MGEWHTGRLQQIIELTLRCLGMGVFKQCRGFMFQLKGFYWVICVWEWAIVVVIITDGTRLGGHGVRDTSLWCGYSAVIWHATTDGDFMSPFLTVIGNTLSKVIIFCVY